jgi:hypothetical protein
MMVDEEVELGMGKRGPRRGHGVNEAARVSTDINTTKRANEVVLRTAMIATVMVHVGGFSSISL